MSRWILLLVAVPLAGASVAIMTRHGTKVGRTVAFSVIAFVLVFGAVLVAATSDGTVLATQVGGWPAPFGISMAVDLFSALMVTVAALMVLVCTAFGAARGEDERPFFYALIMVLLAGICGAFITADLFNLFVFFEVMLIASYVLITIDGTKEQVRAGSIYVATNLLASTVLLAGVAFVYGVAGTVNMAALRDIVGGQPEIVVAAGLLLVAFSVKASLVPVHGWLPRSYPAATPAVAALFSGLLTKVGIYAMFRVYSIVFGGNGSYRSVLLAIAGTSMLLGVFGAIGRDGMRTILSFHIVSQVGYMVMGLGLFGTLGVAGGIFYILHHIVVKTSLFLAAGSVETLEGHGALADLGGVARRNPVLATGFIVAALSLAGLPPFSGFFAKLILVQAAFESSNYLIAGVSILVSLFTLLSMIKIWNGAFWGEAPVRTEEDVDGRRVAVVRGASDGRVRPVALVAPGVLLASLTVALGLFAEGLLALSERAARVLVEATPYIEAVLS